MNHLATAYLLGHDHIVVLGAVDRLSSRLGSKVIEHCVIVVHHDCVESLAAALDDDFLIAHSSLSGCVFVCVYVYVCGCDGLARVTVTVFGGSHVTRYAAINPKQQKLLCVLHPHMHTHKHTHILRIRLDFSCV